MIEVKNLCKNFSGVNIITDLSFDVSANEFIVIKGTSGSGKTTLLNMIGHLDHPSSGLIKIDQKELRSKKDIRNAQRYTFGYIFQNFLLMNNKTVEENLLVSKKFSNEFDNDAILTTLDKVGLNKSILTKKVYQLSGGEQQRIAIARTLLKPCNIILADEPTGNLDSKNKKAILQILLNLKKEGKTVLCVTHDDEISAQADRIIYLESSNIPSV